MTNKVEDPVGSNVGDATGAPMVAIVAETAVVGKRTVETGRVLIHKSLAETDEVIDALLDRQDVEVERVPIGRVVAEAPSPRQDGDTWVLPIMEEVLVVEKRLVLKEELRIRTATTQHTVQQTVRLRREIVDIERQDAGIKRQDAGRDSN